MLQQSWNGNLAESGVSLDVYLKSVSINGVDIPELMSGAVGHRAPDGTVQEQEHAAYVLLRDGAIVSDIRESVRCDLCAVEVDDEARRRSLTPFQILVASRHHPSNIERSALSGISLCQRHCVRVPLDDGSVVAISPHEHRDLLRRCSSESAITEYVRRFVQHGGSRALP